MAYEKKVFSQEETKQIIEYYLAPHSLNDTTKFAGITKNVIIKKLLIANKIPMHSKTATVKLQVQKLNFLNAQKGKKTLVQLLAIPGIKEDIIQKYIVENRQFKDLLDYYQISWATFARLLKKLGIEKDKNQQTSNITKNKFEKYVVDKEELQKYFDMHTVEDTIKHFNIPGHFLYKLLKEYEIDDTKHKTNIPNGSTPEEAYYKKLVSFYGRSDVKRQYKETRYPYKCDFYVKSKDLFIELNLHWTHGGHPFDKSNQEDFKKLELWQNKAAGSEFYKSAIDVWTKRDPEKLKCLKDNNLNYKIFYSVDELNL